MISEETRMIVLREKDNLRVVKRAHYRGLCSRELLELAAERYRRAIRAHAEATGKRLPVPPAAKLMR